jgi:hypothetical protein
MNSDFKDVMLNRTDEELIKIVTVNRDGYQPLAVIAAEEEIKKRGLDQTKFKQIKIELIQRTEQQKQFESKKVSSLKRLVHFLLDTVAIMIVAIIFTFILGLLWTTTNHSLADLVVLLMITLGFFSYYILWNINFKKHLVNLSLKQKL